MTFIDRVKLDAYITLGERLEHNGFSPEEIDLLGSNASLVKRFLEAFTPELVQPPTAKQSPDFPVEDLNLNVKAYNILKREGVNSVRQLVSLSEEQVRYFRNADDNVIAEITSKLGMHNLGLRQAT